MKLKLGLLLLGLGVVGSAGCEWAQFTPHDDECHFNQNLELDCSDDDQPPLKGK